MRIKHFNNLFVHPMMGARFGVWWRLWWVNGFQMERAFIPKFIFMTITILLNTPFHWFERLRFGRKIKQQQVKRPVFILGHPRSGTTHLFYLLSKDKQFAYCSTYDAILPNIFLSGGDFFKRIVGASMPETRPQDNVKVTIDSPKEEEFAMANSSVTSYLFGFFFPKRAAKHFKEGVIYSERDWFKKHWSYRFDYFLKKLNFKYKGKSLLLKSPANTARIAEILALYPDARFIHIHRDPVEVFQSTERLYEKIIETTGFQNPSKEDVRAYILYSYKAIHEKYLKERALIPEGHLVECSYDALVTNPEAVLQQIYVQLGIGDFNAVRSYFHDEIEASKYYVKNAYSSVDESIKALIRTHWKTIYTEFGYLV